MLRICNFVLAGSMIVGSPALADGVQEVFGESTNGLQPLVLITRLPEKHDWILGMNFFARTNIPPHAWLTISNRVSSRLAIKLPSGKELQPKNPDARGALHLPAQTTVGDVMRGYWGGVRIRGAMWLMNDGANSGETSGQTTTFSLREAFEIPFDMDVTLDLTPLLYKVETNMETVHLVEFPPIRIQLLANGGIRADHILHRLMGDEDLGLQPLISLTKTDSDWDVAVGFFPADRPRYHWLKPTNDYCSELRLWLSDGSEVRSQNPKLLAAMRLPPEIVVTNRALSSSEAEPWLTIVELNRVAQFSLRSAFDIAYTNDVALQITPLLYRVDVTSTRAHLVHLPPLRVKLLPDGSVQRLTDGP